MKNPPEIKKPVSKAQLRRRQQQLKHLARIRGKEREDHFANGGTLHEWRGCLHTVTINRKKQRNKKACRGKQCE